MAKRDAVGVLDRIFEKAAKNPRGRSDLAKFLTANHDAFAERLGQGPVGWQALARAFEEEGLLKAGGKLSPPELLRRTWARVTKRQQRARSGTARRPSVEMLQAKGQAPEPGPRDELPPGPDETHHDDAAGDQFRPVAPIGWNPHKKEGD